MPKVLLSSVFKPFGVDSLYSRKDSVIDLFSSRITRFQGPFSPRLHYQSFGLHAIANNIETPTVVLDFPTLSRFSQELKKGYEYVGIGSVVCNFQKIKRMVKEVRQVSPGSKVIIGGFCSTIPNIKQLLGVDYVCAGEGISFMRELLGFSPEFKFRQPDVYSRLHSIFGVPVFWKEYRLVLIVGLGCPYSCEFCSPSHFFGRKHINLLASGEDIYREIVRLSDKYHQDTITFDGDDNFLVDEKRARELQELMVKGGRQFNIFFFASADLVVKWDPADLAEMGVNTIWIGRESKLDPYPKNKNIDLKELIGQLRRYGIKVVLSSILLMDGHTKENVWDDLDDHYECRPTFSQFSFLSPLHGTPLWERFEKEGRLVPGLAYEEMFAWGQPWFVHPHFTLEEAEQLQNQAYLKEFHRLGPGVTRQIEVDFEGYLNLKDSPRPFLRERAKFLAKDMSRYKVILVASEWLVPRPEMREPLRELRKRIEAHFGKTTVFEKAQAAVLFAFGAKQNIVEKFFGNVLQPKTLCTRYNYSGQ